MLHNFLSEEFINTAYKFNNWIGGSLAVMSMFGVVGFEKNSMCKATAEFLTQEGIAFKKAHRLLWFPDISEGLQKLFETN